MNERSRQQDEDNERLKSEISFLRWVVMVVEMVVGGEGEDKISRLSSAEALVL